ncbi:MAG: hypothetical protein ACRDRO_13680 [Pseudonocardiaceae bacterium]
MCDDPDVVAFYRLVVETPALTAAHTRYLGSSEAALTTALRDAVPRAEQTARLAACQIVAVLRVLAHEYQVRISAGQPADALAPDALAEANHAVNLL